MKLAQIFRSGTLMQWSNWATMILQLSLVLLIGTAVFPPEILSIWLIVNTLISFQFLADAGFAPTIARCYSQAYAGRQSFTDDGTQGVPLVGELLRSSGVVYRRLVAVTAVLFLVIFVVSLWGPIGHLASKDEKLSCWMAAGLAYLAVLLNVGGKQYIAFLEGNNRLYEHNRIRTAANLLSAMAGVAVLLSTRQIVAATATTLAGEVIFFVWVRARALRIRKDQGLVVSPAPNPAQENLVVFLWARAWRSAVGIFLGYSVVQASGIVYAQIAPPAEAAAYLIALRAALAIRKLSCAPFYSQLPKLNQLFVSDRHRVLPAAAVRVRASLAIFAALSVAALLLAEPVLKVLNKDVGFVTMEVWLLLSLAGLVERFGAMILQLYTLSHDVVWHIANGVTGAAFIMLAILAYGSLELVGVAFAMLISYGLIYMPYSLNRAGSLYGGVRLVAYTVTVSSKRKAAVDIK